MPTLKGLASVVAISAASFGAVGSCESTPVFADDSTAVGADGCAYVVKQGDTPWDLKQKYGIDIIALATENGTTAEKAAKKLMVPGKIIDTCLNGVNDTVPYNPTTTTAPTPVAETPATTKTVPKPVESCPTDVKSKGEITQTCKDMAIAKLRSLGFKDDDFTRALEAYQIEAGITSQNKSGYGVFGPATYSSLMNDSGANTLANATDKIKNGIVIDISDQTLNVYVDGNLVFSVLVSTGLSTATENRETRLGKFTVGGNRTSPDGWVHSDLEGPGAQAAMYKPYFFDKDEAIHGTRAERRLGKKASHGCTRTAQNVLDKLVSQRLLFIGQIVVVQA